MSISKRQTFYFYEIGLDLFYITDDCDELQQHPVFKKNTKTNNYYEAGQDYECSLEGLLKYREDFNIWVNEIVKSVNYRKYYQHRDAVFMTFNSKSTNIQKKLNIENVIFKEFLFIEKCSNGGLISVDKSILEKEIQVCGYDFSAFYPNLLGTDLGFEIPIKEGETVFSHEIDTNNLEYGIYNVKITSTHPEFYKIFSFSRHHYYTHYSIIFCQVNKDKFNINIEFLDGEHMIWSKDKVISSHTLFGDWFKHLSKLKTKYPENKLVKKLMSSLWGVLTQYDRIFKNEDDALKLDISEKLDTTFTKYKCINEKHYSTGFTYEIVKTENPYKTNLARLKPFLTSYARNFVANMILESELLNDVVRIHTDGICLNKGFCFQKDYKYFPKLELKTTGLLRFNNVNNYDKYCEECKEWILHKDKEHHKHWK